MFYYTLFCIVYLISSSNGQYDGHAYEYPILLNENFTNQYTNQYTTESSPIDTSFKVSESDYRSNLNQSSLYPLYVDDVVENVTQPLTAYRTDLVNNLYDSQTTTVPPLSTVSYNTAPNNPTQEHNTSNTKPLMKKSKFSCYGRQFGQFADVENDCRVFHLCYPFINNESEGFVYQRITFLCLNDTVFDQSKLICVDNSTLSYRCQESPSHYKSSNHNYVSRILSYLNDINVHESRKPTPTPRPNPLWNLFGNL